MKKIKTVISLLLSVTLLISFSGCSFKLRSFDKLLRPPKLTGINQKLQASFDTYVKNNYDFVVPENGEYQSSFILKDIDGDGTDEALVFYSEGENSGTINFCYFEYKDEKFYPVCKNEGLGNSVDRVFIADFNNDNVLEIVIGWGFFESKTNKIFAVYKLLSNKFQSVVSYQYNYIDIFDVDGNGINEIFTLHSKTMENERVVASATVYRYDDNTITFQLAGETAVDGNVSSYNKVSVENKDGANLIYIDAFKGVDEMNTEVVYWDEEKGNLVSPLFDTQTQTVNSTLRKANANCTDINNDNLLEIPVGEEMKGSSVTDTPFINGYGTDQQILNESAISYTKWMVFRNDKLENLNYSVINDNYMLFIPSSWAERITVRGNKNQWDFYRWNSVESDVGDLLFSIITYERTDIDAQKKYGRNYKTIKNSGKYTYAYNITESGSQFGVKDATIINNFRIYNFTTN